MPSRFLLRQNEILFCEGLKLIVLKLFMLLGFIFKVSTEMLISFLQNHLKKSLVLTNLNWNSCNGKTYSGLLKFVSISV